MQRLVVVAGRGDRAVVAGQRAEQPDLGEAEVLELVDEHVGVAGASAFADVRSLVEQRLRAQHEVAGVEQALLGQQPVVGVVERRELALALRRGHPRPAAIAAHSPKRSAVTSSSLRRSMREMTPASIAAGSPLKSWLRITRSSTRVSSIASRSAGVAGATNGSRPASSASSRNSRAQKPGTVETCSSSNARSPRRSSIRARRSSAAPGVSVTARIASAGDAFGDQPGEALDEQRRLAGAGAAEHEQRPAAVTDGGLRTGPDRAPT